MLFLCVEGQPTDFKKGQAHFLEIFPFLTGHLVGEYNKDFLKKGQNLNKLLLRIGIIGSLASLVYIGATSAFFSDLENSVDNVLADGGIDLQIDNSSWYNGVAQPEHTWVLKDLDNDLFFNFQDLKPGDWEEDTISLHVNDNDAWVCANVTLTESADNGINEPEGAAGDTTDGTWNGELDENLKFIFWADDGDNVLETGENVVLTGGPDDLPQNPGTPGTTFAIADAANNIFTGSANSPIPGNSTRYIGKAFCFGDLTENRVAAGAGVNPGVNPGITCNGSLVTNSSQTDSVKGDISFTAVQSRDLPNYICGQPIPTPVPSASPTPSVNPSPLPTPSSEPFIDAVTAVNGTFGHCCDSNNLSSDPSVAAALVTGAPDSPPDADFIQISDNSTVTTMFVNNKAIPAAGADIRIHVYDALFPADAMIEVSQDCSSYTSLGIFSDSANVDLDIESTGYTEVKCVRITDQVAVGDPFPTLGFDLDAIEALHSLPDP